MGVRLRFFKAVGLLLGLTYFMAEGAFSHDHRHAKIPANRPRNLKVYHPQPRKRRAPDPAIAKLLAQVDTQELRGTVEYLSSIENRSVNSPGIQDATNYLFTQFTRLGYSPERQCFRRAPGGEICNVLARKAAAAPTQDLVIVVAHFDSVGKSRAGADDNASGTAGLMEIARLLQSRPSRTNVLFAAVNGEEAGLWGSSYLVSGLEREGQLRNVTLAMVMDMEAYYTGRVDVETYEAHRALGQSFVNDIANYIPDLPARLIIPGWGSDHVPFLKKGAPSFLAINDTDVQVPCYHKACDQPNTLDYVYFTKMIRVSLLAVIKAAGVTPVPTP